MYALGRHLILELKNCNKEVLNDVEFLRDCLSEAAIQCGSTILGESFHRFSPHGVSGIISIAESHISIHTWPEHGYAAADVFTCGDNVDPEKIAGLIKQGLQSKDCSITELRRGVLEQSEVRSAVKL